MSRKLLSAAASALLDERRMLSLDELSALSTVPDESVPSLAALAHEVRLAYCGPEVEIEGILSAKPAAARKTATSAASHPASTRR